MSTRRQIILPKAQDDKVLEMMNDLTLTRTHIIRMAIDLLYKQHQRDKEKAK